MAKPNKNPCSDMPKGITKMRFDVPIDELLKKSIESQNMQEYIGDIFAQALMIWSIKHRTPDDTMKALREELKELLGMKDLSPDKLIKMLEADAKKEAY